MSCFQYVIRIHVISISQSLTLSGSTFSRSYVFLLRLVRVQESFNAGVFSMLHICGQTGSKSVCSSFFEVILLFVSPNDVSFKFKAWTTLDIAQSESTVFSISHDKLEVALSDGEKNRFDITEVMFGSSW